MNNTDFKSKREKINVDPNRCVFWRTFDQVSDFIYKARKSYLSVTEMAKSKFISTKANDQAKKNSKHKYVSGK